VDFSLVEDIGRAILYEGYLLYPYRTSSLKNCRPCAFGSPYPRIYSQANGDIEPWFMQIECLVRSEDGAAVQGAVRFLHGGRERAVVIPEHALPELAQRAAGIAFSFAELQSNSLEGRVELSALPVALSTYKLCVRVENVTPMGSLEHAMLSTYAVLGVRGGRFLSLIDPPTEARDLAPMCRNRGAWPVLAGDRDRQDMLLVAPIILYDFPQLAPHSPGNLFDATEIDELLTLRILTLTDSEKHELKADERTRALLERTESLSSEQRLALHGTCQPPTAAQTIKPGARVRIRPRGRADVLDLALEGKSATVVSLEQDFEGRVFCTVALDDDPGQDLGVAGQPGHRFFFRSEELEPLSGDE
jgi:hypothetical protein